MYLHPNWPRSARFTRLERNVSTSKLTSCCALRKIEVKCFYIQIDLTLRASRRLRGMGYFRLDLVLLTSLEWLWICFWIDSLLRTLSVLENKNQFPHRKMRPISAWWSGSDLHTTARVANISLPLSQLILVRRRMWQRFHYLHRS